MTINFKLINYSKFEEQINHLTVVTADFLKQNNIQIDKIFAVPRGGLPIGVHLSNHLNIDLITTESEYLKCDPEKVLVVDDVCDSGETFEKFKTSTLCCIFAKPRRTVNPDIYLEDVSDDTWLVFPWENQYDTKINKQYMQTQI